LGLTNLIITSDNVKFDNQRYLRRLEKRLALYQQKLSRKKYKSNNYEKMRLKVQKIHKKIKDQRLDYLHKISHQITENYDIISIEDLNVKSMMKNHKLAKSIADVSWGELVRQIKYKAEWKGKTVVKIGRYYPSSQICHKCGHKDGKKELDIREWTCSNCGSVLDRDINAAINIKNEGLRIIKEAISAVVDKAKELNIIGVGTTPVPFGIMPDHCDRKPVGR